jgi:hypothetical protein
VFFDNPGRNESVLDSFEFESVSLRQVGEYSLADLRVTGDRDSNARGGLELYGQANKRKRWMPWQSEAKKDVAACEKRGGAGNEH